MPFKFSVLALLIAFVTALGAAMFAPVSTPASADEAKLLTVSDDDDSDDDDSDDDDNDDDDDDDDDDQKES